MSKRQEFVEDAPKPEPFSELAEALYGHRRQAGLPPALTPQARTDKPAPKAVEARELLEQELKDAQARIGRLMNRVGSGKRIPPGDVRDLMHILMRAYGDAVVVDTLGRARG